MTEGTPWKKILAFSVPILLGNLFQQFYTTVDTWMVGVFVSQDALSAVGTVSVLTYLCLAFAVGFSAGAGVIVSRLFGAKDHQHLTQTAWNSLVLLVGIGVLVTGAALLWSRFLLQSLVNVPESILDEAELYFRVVTLGFLFEFVYNGIAALLRAIGDSRAMLYFLILSCLGNVAGDYLFIVPLQMGVAGAAWSTVLSQLACCVVSYLYMHRKYEMFRFDPTKQKIRRAELREIVKQGGPLALQTMIGTFYNLFMQRLVNSFGDAMTASYTVVSRVEAYIQLPTSTLTTTLATYSAQNKGAGKAHRIREGLITGIALSVGLTLLLSAAGFFFADQIAAFFKISGLAAEYCVTNIHTYAFAMLSFAAYFPATGYYQGNGKAYLSAISSVAYLCLSLLIGYAFRSVIGVRVLYISKPITWVVIGILNFMYLLLGPTHLNAGGAWRQENGAEHEL